jgi:hypothetical protein
LYDRRPRHKSQWILGRPGVLVWASFLEVVAVVLGTPVAVYTPVGKLLVFGAECLDVLPECLVVELGALVIMLAGGVPGIPASVLMLAGGEIQSAALL